MTNTRELTRYRAVAFPDPPEPHGATTATIGTLYGNERYFSVPAVGVVRVELDERQALELTEAIPGQVASLLGSFGSSVIDRIDIVCGALSTEDLRAISTSHVRDLRLGTPRRELAAPESGVIDFVDGPDLSKLKGIHEFAVDYVPLTDEHLMSLGATYLSSLRLAGTGVDIGCLQRFPILRSLYLEGEDIGSDLSPLSGMSHLQCLDARFTSLTADQLVHLRACDNLRTLAIGYNAGLTPDLSLVGALSDLSYLDVSTTAVDDTTLGTIRSLRWLKSFIAQCTHITDGGAGELGQWPTLTRLNLAGTRITDEGLLRIVKACPWLTHLDLRSTDVTESGLAEHLVKLTDLRVLGASGDVLSSDLAGRLKEHTAIVELVIGPPMEGDGWVEAVDWIGSARMPGQPA